MRISLVLHQWALSPMQYDPRMISQRLWKALYALLLLCAMAGVRGQALNLTELPPGYLGGHAELLLEDGAPLTQTQAQIRFEAGQGVKGERNVPGFGIGARAVWLHWTLLNSTDISRDMRLSIGTTWLDAIDIYVIGPERQEAQWRMGDERDHASGLKAAIGYEVAPVFAPGRSELYVRVQSIDPMVVPIELLTPEQAARNDELVRYTYGFIYGFLIALVAYNFMLYAGLRDRNHLLYSVYLTTLICLNLAYTGHGLAWIWPGQPDLQRYVILGLMVVFGCAGLLFARRFLDLKSHAPRTDAWISRGSAGVLALFALSVVVQSHLAAALLAFVFFGVFTVSMVYLGLLTVHHRRVSGRYFLPAVVFGMLGGGSTFLVVLGLTPFNTLSYHALELGIILEATLLALAVAHQVRLHQQATLHAEHLASHDPLTGLHNRRAFQERGQALWSTSARGHRPLSMILLDLDYFKQVNDTHGHATGDQALVMSAQLLTKACRAGDVLARWGGEEFILLLPETDIEQACVFAERLRQEFVEQKVHTEHQTLQITASFGVAQRGAHTNLEALIKSADVALYEAKHAGRNQVQRARRMNELPL